jgi:hypothetical protein
MRNYLKTKVFAVTLIEESEALPDLNAASLEIFHYSKPNETFDRYTLGEKIGYLVQAHHFDRKTNRNIHMAFEGAELAHATQPLRKDKQPQINHDFHVAIMALNINHFFELNASVPELCIIAALHDVFEDIPDFYAQKHLYTKFPGLTPCPPDERDHPPKNTDLYILNSISFRTKLAYNTNYINGLFNDLFGKKISIGNKVMLLTRRDQEKNISEKEKKIRKDLYYRKIAKAPVEVLLVKLADRMCNLLNYIHDLPVDYTLRKFPKKFNETIKYFKIIFDDWEKNSGEKKKVGKVRDWFYRELQNLRKEFGEQFPLESEYGLLSEKTILEVFPDFAGKLDLLFRREPNMTDGWTMREDALAILKITSSSKDYAEKLLRFPKHVELLTNPLFLH